MRKATLTMTVLCGMVLFVARDSLAAGAGDPVTLSISVGGEYTDNRDSVPQGEDNFDFFLTPRLDAKFRSEADRTILNLYYAPSYRYRTDPSAVENDTELHHDLGIEFLYKMTEIFRVRANERFNLTDDPAITDNGTTLRRDCSYTMNRADLGLTLKAGNLMDIDVMGEHMVKMYDLKEVAVESDEESLDGRLRFWHAFSPTFGGMLDLSAQKFDYDSSRGLKRGFTSVAGGLGLENKLGAILRGSLWCGMNSVEYDDGALGSDSAPYVNLLLKLEPIPEKTAITVSGSYGLRNSDVYPFASQEYTGIGLDLDWNATAFWSFGVSGGYRMGHYNIDAAPVTSTDPTYVRPAGGDVDVVLAQARATFKFNDKTSIQLVQSYEDAESDISTSLPFTRNATRLTLSKQF